MLNSHDLSWRTACAAAIAGMPMAGPARIAAVLSDLPPEDAWLSLAEGGSALRALHKITSAKSWPDLKTAVMRYVRRTEPLEVLEAYSRAGIYVWSPMAEYPGRLADDPWAPLVLFGKGRTEVLDQPTVAIVGTRHCSAEGRRTAERFGRELTEANIAVVSGLALGIDGAAHVGALDAHGTPSPIGVVGSGLDVVYPRRHADIWQAVTTQGLLISESPLGTPPERWRFPARNRIIAGLADVVVVIESHETGGSLLTVDEAALRGRQVMAVPGSVNSPASRGTNALLRDGCAPACSADDILQVLSLSPSANLAIPVLPPVSPTDHPVLEAVDWQPTTTEEVMQRSGRPLGEVAETLLRLQQTGYLVGMGGWWQRVAEVVGDEVTEG